MRKRQSQEPGNWGGKEEGKISSKHEDIRLEGVQGVKNFFEDNQGIRQLITTNLKGQGTEANKSRTSTERNAQYSEELKLGRLTPEEEHKPG